MKKIIEITDISPIVLFGTNNENMKIIEDSFESEIISRGNKVNLNGEKNDIELISKVIQDITSLGLKKEFVSKKDVETIINLIKSENRLLNQDELIDDVIILNSHKGPIIAKTKGQKKYFKEVLNNDIVYRTMYSVGVPFINFTELSLIGSKDKLEDLCSNIDIKKMLYLDKMSLEDFLSETLL